MKTYKLLLTALLINVGAQAQQYIDTPLIVQPVVAAKALGCNHFTLIWNKLVFTAGNVATTGAEWWMYDGINATAGPELYPGKPNGIKTNTPYYNSFHIVHDNKIYYSGVDPTHGNEPFVWDGTSTPPQLLSDIVTGAGNSEPSGFSVSNGKLFFLADPTTAAFHKDVYEYDLTSKQLKMIKSGVKSETPFTSYNGKVYYMSPINGSDLVEYDPVSTNTKIIASAVNGFANFTPYGSKLYFTKTGVGDLYVYDGGSNAIIANNTSGLYGLVGGYSSNDTRPVYTHNGKIYYWHNDNNYKYTLKTYDTLSGSVATVTNFPPVLDDPYPRLGILLINNGNILYRHKQKLSWFNGNKTHTVLPMDFRPISSAAYKNEMYVSGYFDSVYYMLRLKDTLVSLSVQNVAFDADVQLYPNPTTGNANINLSLDNAISVAVAITDVTGKVIVQTPPQQYAAGKNSIKLPTAQLPPATYIVYLKGKGGVLLWSGKLLKQ